MFRGHVAARDQQPVARLQVQGDALQVGARVAHPRQPDLRRAGRHRVPCRAGLDLLDRLERLRLLAGCGDALDPQAGLEDHALGRHLRVGTRIARGGGRDLGRRFDREREVGLRRDAGTQPVADEPTELLERDPFARRAQVRLVGEAFRVERQDIRHDRPRIEDGDRDIVGIAGRQVRETRAIDVGQTRDHRVEEVAVPPDAIRDRGQAGPVVDGARRAARDTGAAAAGRASDRHLPPPIASVSSPRSGNVGSFSSWGISSRAKESTPESIALVEWSRWRSNVRRCDRLDAFHGLDRRDDRREVDRLAEREPVGVEESQRAVGPDAARQDVEHGRFDVGAEILRQDADAKADLERDESWTVDLEVIAGHPERLDVAPDANLELVVDIEAAGAVGGDEDRVPRAGPAEGRRRSLDLATPLRDPGVVAFCDRALLDKEGLGSVAADRVSRLRLRAAGARRSGWRQQGCSSGS